MPWFHWLTSAVSFFHCSLGRNPLYYDGGVMSPTYWFLRIVRSLGLYHYDHLVRFYYVLFLELLLRSVWKNYFLLITFLYRTILCCGCMFLHVRLVPIFQYLLEILLFHVLFYVLILSFLFVLYILLHIRIVLNKPPGDCLVVIVACYGGEVFVGDFSEI